MDNHQQHEQKTDSGIKEINWLNVILLSLGAGTVYLLPYMRNTFYDSLQIALGVNHTQLGVIQGFFGFLMLVCYFPGGFIADRFPASKLLFVSFLGTGLGGLYFSTFPSFTMTVVIHVWFGITATLTFWAAFVKAQRLSAPPRAQAKVFGFTEAGRRIVSTVASLIAAWLISRWSDTTTGLRMVIYFYSAIMIVVAFLVLFFFKEDPRYAEEGPSSTIAMKDLMKVMKMPAIWLCALIIMCIYYAYRNQDIMTPYSTNICGLSAAMGATLATVRYYGIAPLGAVIGGFMGDRIKPSSTMILGALIVLGSSVVFILVPGTPATLMIIVCNLMIFMTAHFMMRSVFYALLEEGKVPIHYTGVATGIIATIGYSGDFIAPIYQGFFLDHFPGQAGYNCIFATSVIAAALCVVFCLLFRRTALAKALDEGKMKNLM
jgi:sugar phosphate permease